MLDNFTDHKNKGKSVKDIKNFMQSIGVAVDKVGQIETIKVNMIETNRNISKENTAHIASSTFNQTHIGLDSTLTLVQKREHAAHFENLTNEHTYEYLLANFEIINQEIIAHDGENNLQRLRRSGDSILTVKVG